MSRTSYQQQNDKSLLCFCGCCLLLLFNLVVINFISDLFCVCSPTLNIYTKIVLADISN